MKHVLIKGISLCVMCVCLLGGCEKENSSNTDIVKNMVFEEYSNAISVGQALDNFVGCQPKTQKWTASETSNGAQIVEFSCDAQDIQEFVSSIKEYIDEKIVEVAKLAKNSNDDPDFMMFASGMRNALDMSRVQYRIQFTLAKDKQSSQISFAGFDYIWRDGKKIEDSVDEGPLLTRAYSNQTLKDELKIASYKDLSRLDKEAYAKDFVKLYGEALKSITVSASPVSADSAPDNSDSALNYCEEYDGVKEALLDAEKEFIRTELGKRGVDGGVAGKRFTIQAKETPDSMGGPEFKCTGVATVLSGDAGRKFLSYNIAYSMFIDEGNIGIETNMRSNIQSELPVVPQTNEVQEVNAESQKQQMEEKKQELEETERQSRLKEQERQSRLKEQERQQQKKGVKLKDVFNALKSIKREGPAEVNPTD